MKISLIVTVYKDAEALRAVLSSLLLQRFKEFEVIVAQDCEGEDLDSVLNEFREKLSLQHIQQPDRGFQKNKILNKAIRAAKADKLVFIDGDCVLHSSFLNQYNEHLQEGRFCVGRRVMTDPKNSQKMRQGECVTPGFCQMLFGGTTYLEEGIFLPFVQHKLKKKSTLLGCNMGWMKSDLIRLNGFDEDYVHPGYGEDSDIEFRAHLAGLKPFSMRFKALQYHLHHERPDREEEIAHSFEKFKRKKKEGHFFCANGLNQ